MKIKNKEKQLKARITKPFRSFVDIAKNDEKSVEFVPSSPPKIDKIRLNFVDFVYPKIKVRIVTTRAKKSQEKEKTMSEYNTIKKNTVEAGNQLQENKMIRFYNKNGKGKKIMFVGNSITLHGKKSEIGWNFEHGMAASAEEKDYVHLLMGKINNAADDCAFCVCQAAEWEKNYLHGRDTFPLYTAARDFSPDILIFRIIENCSVKNFDKDILKNKIIEFLQYLDPEQKTKIVFTTSFWRHPGDITIAELADTKKAPLVSLGDLGERNDMKAIGLFEHSGVAEHPGDLGMKMIAERIFDAVKSLL